jgi:hypothetical protein
MYLRLLHLVQSWVFIPQLFKYEQLCTKTGIKKSREFSFGQFNQLFKKGWYELQPFLQRCPDK